MAKYVGAKCRQCRREGTKLFLKGEKCYTSKCPVENRPFPPGQHGQLFGAKVGAAIVGPDLAIALGGHLFHGPDRARAPISMQVQLNS